MIRQYRIDRFNGLEVLVCEVYRKHTFSQREYEALQAWKLDREKMGLSFSEPDFRNELGEWLDVEHEPNETFYGLTELIPVYNFQPHLILRGVVVDNRIVSLQVEYDSTTLSPEVIDAVAKFYGVMDSRHWRNMVSHQLERYGTLFGSSDD